MLGTGTVRAGALLCWGALPTCGVGAGAAPRLGTRSNLSELTRVGVAVASHTRLTPFLGRWAHGALSLTAGMRAGSVLSWDCLHVFLAEAIT